MTLFTVPRGMQEWPLEEPTIVRVPWNSAMGRARLELRPQRRCRPFALLTWGCRPESTIHSIFIGDEEQLLGPVPGGAFPCMLEYADFEPLLDRRADDHHAIRALWRLFSYQNIYLPHVELGGAFSIELEGPFEHIVFLTKMPVIEEGAGSKVQGSGSETPSVPGSPWRKP